MASQAEYDAGTAAAMNIIQEVETHIPGMFRGMIPHEKEHPAAVILSKAIIDAAAAVRAKSSP